jgi:hypothetical protein
MCTLQESERATSSSRLAACAEGLGKWGWCCDCGELTGRAGSEEDCTGVDGAAEPADGAGRGPGGRRNAPLSGVTALEWMVDGSLIGVESAATFAGFGVLLRDKEKGEVGEAKATP